MPHECVPFFDLTTVLTALYDRHRAYVMMILRTLYTGKGVISLRNSRNGRNKKSIKISMYTNIILWLILINAMSVRFLSIISVPMPKLIYVVVFK